MGLIPRPNDCDPGPVVPSPLSPPAPGIAIEGKDMEMSLADALPLVGVFTVVAFVLAGFGARWNRALFPAGIPEGPSVALSGWAVRLYVRSMPLHPVAAGALLGLAPLPAPDFLGPSVWARALWYAAAGVASYPIYQAVMSRLDALDGVTGNDGR